MAIGDVYRYEGTIGEIGATDGPVVQQISDEFREYGDTGAVVVQVQVVRSIRSPLGKDRFSVGKKFNATPARLNRIV